MNILENKEFIATLKKTTLSLSDLSEQEGYKKGAIKAQEILTKEFNEEKKKYITLNQMFAFQSWIDKKTHEKGGEKFYELVEMEYPEIYQLYLKEKSK